MLLAELGPKAPHVNIDGPGTSEVLVAPDPDNSVSRLKTRPGCAARKRSNSYSMYVRSSGRPDRRLVGLQVERKGP